MNWLTILLAVILGVMTYRAYRNGFVRELVSLCAVVLAIPLAGIFYSRMVPKVEPIVDDASLARLISFLAIFLGVIVAGQVAAHLLKRTVSLLNLGFADQLAGAMFGLLKGILICQAVLLALVVFPNPDLTSSIDDSPLATRLLDSSPLILAVLPSRFDVGLDQFLNQVQDAAGVATPTATPPR
jgi:membrane protein required for colicin V production